MRHWISVFIVFALAMPALAEEKQGWTFSGRFQGSSNTSGVVMKVDPTLGYRFSRHFQTYLGLPAYFVNKSSTTSTTSGSTGFMKGLGNAFVGVNLGTDSDTVNFASRLEATAPTGDKDKGFSTGRATIDWTNTLSRNFSSVTPFASLGLANTVSDTSFFVRPFTSLGLVSHFDGGATIHLSQFADLGALAYAVKASGEQRIFSKTNRGSSAASGTSSGQGSAKRVFDTNSEVVGTADLANDQGFSTWLAAHAGPKTSFQVGYTRSVGYDLNTVFFGVGFHFGN